MLIDAAIRVVRLFSQIRFPHRALAMAAALLLGLAGMVARAQVYHSGSFTEMVTGLGTPEGVAVDGSGNLFMIENSVGLLTKWTPGSNGSYTRTQLLSGLSDPRGVAVDSTGAVYYVETGKYRVMKMAPSGNGYGTPVDIVDGASVGLNPPVTVAVDGAFNVYVPDPNNRRILLLTWKASTSTYSPGLLSLDPGTGTPSLPYAVAANSKGNYAYSTWDGTNGRVTMYVDGHWSHLDGFSFPDPGGITGLAMDEGNNVYVADAGHNMVVKVIPSSTSSTATGLLSVFKLNHPLGVAADTNGNLFIADTNNNRIAIASRANLTPQAQAGFYSTAIGQTSTQKMIVNFSFAGSTTIQSPQAFGDFTVASTNCNNGNAFSSGGNCWVVLNFAPTAAGMRRGGVRLSASNGSSAAYAYAWGVGLGPQMSFSPGMGAVSLQTFTSKVDMANSLAAYANGDLVVNDNALCALDALKMNSATSYTASSLLGNQGTGGNCDPASTGLAVDGFGNLVYGDQRYINSPTTVVSTALQFLANTAAKTGASAAYAAPASLSTDAISGVAVDPAGNIFYADQSTANKGLWRKSRNANGWITTLVGAATLPIGVAADDSGNVYYLDQQSKQTSLVKLSPALSDATSSTGMSPSTLVQDVGSGYGLAVDSQGQLYVGSSSQQQIGRYDAKGNSLGELACCGQSNDYPEWLATDAGSNLYVGSPDSQAIVKYDVSDPPALAFGSINANGASATHQMTVTNTGQADLVFSSISITSPFSVGSQSGDCMGTTTLTSGSSCTITVSLTPNTAGALSGSVILTDNLTGSGSTQTIPLTATVVGPASIAVTPSSSTILMGATQQFKAVATYADSTTEDVTSTASWNSSAIGTATISATGLANAVAAGTTQITATWNGVTSNQAALSVGSLTPASMTLAPGSQKTQSAFWNQGFANPLAVQIIDERGLPLPGISVLFTSPSGGASATLNGTYSITVQTNANGIAAVAATANSTSGSYGVTASAGTLSLNFSLANNRPYLVVTSAADDAGTAANCTPQAQGDTGSDPACTLRDAILKFHVLGVGQVNFDQNKFAKATTIVLTNGPISVTDDKFVLLGPTSDSGANLLSISGNNASQIFLVSGANFHLSHLNLINGYLGANGKGASAQGGGAMYVSGSMSMMYCNLSGNQAGAGQGGAIMLDNPSGNSSIEIATFNSNQAGGSGGAIFTNSLLSLHLSTFSKNRAALSGGALEIEGHLGLPTGPVDVLNDTFTGNTNNTTATTKGKGSAIDASNSGWAVLTHVTVTGNTGNPGFGAVAYDSTSILIVANNILSGNLDSAGAADDIDFYSAVVSGGKAQSNATPAGSTSNGVYTDNDGNLIGTLRGTVVNAYPPRMAPLGDYGGPTQTLEPLTSSPAFCLGLAANIPQGIGSDQRGYPRSIIHNGTTCVDAGAVQTNFSVQIVKQPGSVQTMVPMTPAPTVQLNDQGYPLALAGIWIQWKDTAGTTTCGTDYAATDTTGLATFSNICIPTGEASDAIYFWLGSDEQDWSHQTSSSFSVALSKPEIEWNMPSAITYPAALGSDALNAFAMLNGNVIPGGVTYTTQTGAVVNQNTVLPAGAYTLTATFTPTDATTYAKVTAQNPLTVNKSAETISFVAPVSSVTYGAAPVTLSATSSSKLTVTLAASGSCSLAASSLKFTGAGTCTVTASQAGNANYLAAAPVTHTIAVAKAPATVTAGTYSILYSQALPSYTVAISGMVNGDTASYTGQPAYTLTPTPVAAAGAYVITPSVGTMLSANYAFTKFVVGKLTIAQMPTKITLASSESLIATSQKVTLTATVAPSSGAAVPLGSVVFKLGATTLGSAALVSGKATLSNVTLPNGTDAITATYQGNADFIASTSAAITVTVKLFAAVIPVLPSGTLHAGSPVLLTASVRAATGGVAPTGTVSFYVTNTLAGTPSPKPATGAEPATAAGPVLLGTATIVGGQAQLSTIFLAEGIEALNFSYSGDANYMPGGSGGISLHIMAPSLGGVAVGSYVTGTYQVPIATAGTLGSVRVLTQGSASLDYTFIAGGSCAVGQAYAAGSSCTVVVKFLPRGVGLRMGVIQLIANNPVKTQMASYPIQGLGQAPILGFGNTTRTAIGSFTSVGDLARDAAGDYFVIERGGGTIQKLTPSATGYTKKQIAGPFADGNPIAIAVDGAGVVSSLIYLDPSSAKLVVLTPSGSGYTQSILALNHGVDTMVADGGGNLFFSQFGDSTGTIYEMPSGTAGTLLPIASLWQTVASLATDAAGNVTALTNDTMKSTHHLIQIQPQVAGWKQTSLFTSSSMYSPVGSNGSGVLATSTGVDASLALYAPSASGYRNFAAVPVQYGYYNMAVDGANNISVGEWQSSIGLYSLSSPSPAQASGSANRGQAIQASGKLLLNMGNQPLTLASLAPSAYAMLASTSTCKAGLVLPVGGSCQVDALLRPTAALTGASAPFTAAIKITSNTMNHSGTVQQLLYTGTETRISPRIELSTPTMPVVTGSKVTITAKLSNIVGPNDLAYTPTGKIMFISSTGVLNGSATLDSKGNAQWSVASLPAGDYTVMASYAGDASFNAVSATLSFSAVGAAVVSGLDNLGIGSVPVGARKTITLAASFSSAFTLNAYTVSGAPDFTLSSTTCQLNHAYAAGTGCALTLTFLPSNTGTRRGAIRLWGSDGQCAGQGYLAGVGVGPRTAFSSGALKNISSVFTGPVVELNGTAVDQAGRIFLAMNLSGEIDGSSYGSAHESATTPASTSPGGQIVQLRPDGKGGYNSSVLASDLGEANAVAVDSAGNLYYASWWDRAVHKLTLGPASWSNTRIGSGFGWPTGLAVDAVGDVFVVDGDSGLLTKLTRAGSTYAASVIDSGFYNPTSLAIDDKGNLYLTDTNWGEDDGHPVLPSPGVRAATAAAVSAVYKETLSGGKYTRSAIGSGWAEPTGVAVDSAGNVFVAESGMGQSTGSLVRLTPNGAGGYTRQALLSGQQRPRAISVDPDGNLNVLDATVAAVRQLSFSAVPALGFQSTAKGKTSADSPRTIHLENQGNAPLTIAAVSAAAADFPLGAATSLTCKAGQQLAAGQSCNLVVSFTPTASLGTKTSQALTESLSITDNNLNVAGTAQKFVLSGTETSK